MVSLVKVESVLLKLLPEEIECCVVEVPDSLKGARIVAALNKEVNQKKMLKAMAEELPAISLPRQFVVLEDFPKMGSGKIDFRTITEMVRQQLQVKS